MIGKSRKRRAALAIALVFALVFALGAAGLFALRSADNRQQPLAPEGRSHIIPPERRIEWSPGVLGGIPSYPVGSDVKRDFGAVGDGVTDDTEALRRALDAARPGHAVFLPPGQYRLTSKLLIPSKVALRGAGPGKTRVIVAHGKTGFDIGARGDSVVSELTRRARKGARELAVSDAAPFEPGSYARIAGPDNVAQIVRVQARQGSELTLERALYGDFEAKSRLEWLPMAEGAGIEDMFIFTDYPQHTGYVNARKVTLSQAASSWVRNIETDGYCGIEVFAIDCYRCEVRDSYFHQSLEGALAEAKFYIYGVELRGGTTDTLVENNIFDFYRHAMVIQHDNIGGNVFGYNMSWSVYTTNESTGKTVRALQTDIEVHHRRVHQVLFEGNHAEHAALHYNKKYEQTLNTLLRNRITQAGIEGATLNHVIGNELPPAKYTIESNKWYPTNKIRVSQGSIVHGNYVASEGAQQWDPQVATREIPTSYYLKKRPTWFCDLDWPAFGGDLMPNNKRRSPAEVRYWSQRFPEQAPSGLEVSVRSGAAHLSWRSNSKNKVDFVVVRGRPGGSFTRVAASEATRYVDETLEPGGEYYYYVRARNHLGGETGRELGGESPASNVVSTKPNAGKPPSPPCESETPSPALQAPPPSPAPRAQPTLAQPKPGELDGCGCRWGRQSAGGASGPLGLMLLCAFRRRRRRLTGSVPLSACTSRPSRAPLASV